MAELEEHAVDPDPIRQVQRWLEEAVAAGVPLPEAMALATATPDGRPSVRMVLLKELDGEGFVFYTNARSRKGQELAANPRAAAALYWEPLGRQVRVEGRAEPVSREQAARYFRSRPPGSQVSAAVSPQSAVVPDRAWLEARYRELAARYPDGAVPVPGDWGGYRIVPEVVELWQHRENRLHDRLRYTREAVGTWRLERLAP